MLHDVVATGWRIVRIKYVAGILLCMVLATEMGVPAVGAAESRGAGEPKTPTDIHNIHHFEECTQHLGPAAMAGCCPADNRNCAMPRTCPNLKCADAFRELLNRCSSIVKDMAQGIDRFSMYQGLYADCWEKFPPTEGSVFVGSSFKRDYRTVSGEIDLEACARWGDGCNMCLIERGILVGCTMNVCTASNKVKPYCLQNIDRIPEDPLQNEALAYLREHPVDAVHNAIFVSRPCSYEVLQAMCADQYGSGISLVWDGLDTPAADFCKSDCRGWSYKMYLGCKAVEPETRDSDRAQVVQLLNICAAPSPRQVTLPDTGTQGS